MEEYTPQFHAGERVSFESDLGLCRGIIERHANWSQGATSRYTITVYARGQYVFPAPQRWLILERNIRGVLPEPVLDESVAQRILDNPDICIIHDRDEVRFIIAREMPRDVPHLHFSCERWPRPEEEDEEEDAPPPLVTFGEIIGLAKTAKEVLFGLQVLEDQMLATHRAILKGAMPAQGEL